MIWDRFSFIIACMGAVILLVPAAYADYPVTSVTHVYFEKNGVPYTGAVHYTYTCYGYSFDYRHITPAPGAYTPSPVYRYSATCREYGCSVYPAYYLQYTHIDWCDLEGDTGEGHFIVRNISRYPYDQCDHIDSRVVLWPEEEPDPHEEYQYIYYATPEYGACARRNNSFFPHRYPGPYSIRRQVYASCREGTDKTCFSLFQGFGGITLKGTDIINRSANRTIHLMNETMLNRYLDSCDPVSDGECDGWILDGRPLKTYAQLFLLRTNTTLIEEYPCYRFLVPTNATFIIPESEWGHGLSDTGSDSMADQTCDVYFTIPSAREPDNTSGTISPASMYSDGGAEVRRSPVESLYCSFLQFFGGRCE